MTIARRIPMTPAVGAAEIQPIPVSDTRYNYKEIKKKINKKEKEKRGRRKKNKSEINQLQEKARTWQSADNIITQD